MRQEREGLRAGAAGAQAAARGAAAVRGDAVVGEPVGGRGGHPLAPRCSGHDSEGALCSRAWIACGTCTHGAACTRPSNHLSAACVSERRGSDDVGMCDLPSSPPGPGYFHRGRAGLANRRGVSQSDEHGALPRWTHCHGHNCARAFRGDGLSLRTVGAQAVYYGDHYSVFIYSSQQRMWRFADDANVRPVGSWKDVVEQCVRGEHGLILWTLPACYSVAGHESRHHTQPTEC